MIRQVADHLAEIFFERKWVDEELRDWCVYTLEKWLGVLLFFLSVTLWMLVSGRRLETPSFLVPFYLLRRRIGGYHTKKPSTCFFASMGLVVLVSTFLGTWLAALPERALFYLDAYGFVASSLLLYQESFLRLTKTVQFLSFRAGVIDSLRKMCMMKSG